MKLFVDLFLQIESTTSSNRKIAALVDYFSNAQKDDALWVIALFTHKRPKRTVNTRLLREWAAEYAGIPLWLFEDTYHVVGDLAETIAKIIPIGESKVKKSLTEWVHFLMDMRTEDEEGKKEKILWAWTGLNNNERFLLNKLITGGFRIGVSQRTIVKALSKYLQKPDNEIAHRLMGDWSPDTTTFEKLLEEEDFSASLSKPYPFYLAYALEGEVEDLGSEESWIAEYKWDGIRAQLIKRGDSIYLWSRGEELITDQFPEFNTLSNIDSDFVIDAELLIYTNEKIQSFSVLQKRLGRKKPSKKLISEQPAILMAYDLFEENGQDMRQLNQGERSQRLSTLITQINEPKIKLSEPIHFQTWEELRALRKNARELNAEGLMLKSKSGEYKTGRKKGDWFKWKLDPYTMDAVMIYAQRGHGRRANLFTDFTFALYNDNKELVTVAKAYSGLSDNEFKEISTFVRKNTIERFGPVHSVPPIHVFEISFEAVAISKRHKSGIALRFPRISRWRKDKPADEINSVNDLLAYVR